ncbi:hypothetical protein EDC01DRAFT_33225 [Geopyxis carbonaria]|nr:hypothetical protein EDC01DRAFT_33225 [Geopyxis carbonaria]
MLSPHHHYPQHRSPVPHPQSTHSVATSTHYEASYTPLYHPTPNQPLSPSKRLKIHDFDFTDIPSTFDCPSLIYPTAMPHTVSRPRSLAPHISVQHASEPASPVTIASTASNHSTPSPSPSRVTIISDGSSHDFPLFDEGFHSSEPQSKQAPRRIFTSNTSNPSPLNTQFNGNFTNSDWPHYFPGTQSMDVPSQQLQQYIQAAVPNFDHANIRTFHHQQQQRPTEDEELPALSPSRNNPMSTSSRPSISDDLPITPVHSPRHRDSSCAAIREDASGFVNEWITNSLHDTIEHSRNVPKLARTVSDAVQDELFNPGIAPGTAHAQTDRQSETNRASQFPSLFQQAQSQHTMARASPVTKPPMIRDHSPFRANSPFHPARTQDPTQSPTRATTFLPVGGYPTARARREREMEREAEALKAQMKKEFEEMQQDPKTISPKDAYIEYNEPESDVRGSLFSSQQDDVYSQHSASNGDALSSNGSYHGSVHDDEDIKTENSYGSMATSRRESDVTMDYGAPMFSANSSQQYNQQNLGATHAYRWSNDHFSQESSNDKEYDYDSAPSPTSQRPEDTKTDSGAYSCTVHGCTQRFPTANKMSRHRREVHRHGTPMNRDAAVRWQHQGPHKCARINPTTGKPCNTIFSRPYDLTRHEDTIHNTAREKVRCEICNDEKTFSRHDALTRHKKVKHGIDK